MIRNDKQYNITKNRLKEFKEAKNILLKNATKKDYTFDLNLAAIESQITIFNQDIDNYDDLKIGFINLQNDNSFFDIGEILIKARIASKLTQKQLAELLNMKEQQIQRYEITEYESASLNTIFDVMDALELNITIGKLKLKNINHSDFGNYLKPKGITTENIIDFEKSIRESGSLLKITA